MCVDSFTGTPVCWRRWRPRWKRCQHCAPRHCHDALPRACTCKYTYEVCGYVGTYVYGSSTYGRIMPKVNINIHIQPQCIRRHDRLRRQRRRHRRRRHASLSVSLCTHTHTENHTPTRHTNKPQRVLPPLRRHGPNRCLRFSAQRVGFGWRLCGGWRSLI